VVENFPGRLVACSFLGYELSEEAGMKRASVSLQLLAPFLVFGAWAYAKSRPAQVKVRPLADRLTSGKRIAGFEAHNMK
jgi:hypothetical protein